MSRGRGVREPQLPNPSELYDPILDLLVDAAFAGAAGAVVGVATRWAGGRWTWAPAITIPVALVAWLVDPTEGALASIGAVTATATAGGLSWRVQAGGGSRRERERRRVGPMKLVARELRLRSRRRRRVRGERLAVGATRERRLVEVPFGRSRGVHGLLVGATDSGKTVTAASIAQATLRAGNAVVAVDPKGDEDLHRLLRREAKRAGVPFLAWTPFGPATYNVARRGDPSEVADKVLSGHEWSEPHYLSIALRFVQREVEVLRACGTVPSLEAIARYMNPERLEAVAVDRGEEIAARVEALTDDVPRRMLEDLAGARSRVALLAESDFGRWLGPGDQAVPEIDLAEVIRSRGVAYFRLESDRYEQLGQLLGASLVVDLVALSADLQGGEMRALLLVDEFAAIAADQVSRLFATARSAGLSVLLIAQGLADLRAARDDNGADTLTSQVIQNVAYVVAHRQSDPDAREFLARLGGTHETWTLTHEVEGYFTRLRTGSGSRIPTHEFDVHPNEFRGLRQGEAVVIENARHQRAERVRVFPPVGAPA